MRTITLCLVPTENSSIEQNLKKLKTIVKKKT